ncbi:hypothetical protein CROQUDRAFT_650460 [Cronartium quercuum f. sp. fusiforme G11]|uniref:glutathione gamma-glutamylcysteinyltransferase n=1 Tax=Cronartium quercuum f. sp. fusiforme G11 TaxID=708437 RepID=A0A9P6NTC8_9BASI|nr:hypothetical protein CROQUDRAFT_650460 [Cronartium quercuum f. sp. fusiforme G11]
MHISTTINGLTQSNAEPGPRKLVTAIPTIDRSKPSFYQRKLPDGCIPFTSEAGKSLFREALDEGHLDAFFPLSSQLVTQHEPSFCGLASLCTVLNALKVDPRRVWKYPWRWYEQDMLDCCRPLEAVQRVGITLSEFNCLARCNGLAVRTASPPPLTKSESEFGKSPRLTLEEFRREIEAATTTSNSFMVVSFSRAALGQTGSGHFSPIAAYAPSQDRVLVLDVARFKYPSYWVTVEELYEAMRPIDPATGLARGFSVLSSVGPSIDSTPRSTTTLALNKSSWAAMSRRLRTMANTNEKVKEPVRVLVKFLSVLDEECPTGVVESRLETKDQMDALLETIRRSTIGIALLNTGYTINGPSILLILALFSGRASVISQSLLVSDLREEVEALVTSVVEEELKSDVHRELDLLAQQISALGDCCAIESGKDSLAGDNGECGCAQKITRE